MNTGDLPIKKGLFHMPASIDDQAHLMGSRCGRCGYTTFPKKEVCVVCRRHGSMMELALGPYGTLKTEGIANG